jgi:hypothetical protein
VVSVSPSKQISGVCLTWTKAALCCITSNASFSDNHTPTQRASWYEVAGYRRGVVEALVLGWYAAASLCRVTSEKSGSFCFLIAY